MFPILYYLYIFSLTLRLAIWIVFITYEGQSHIKHCQQTTTFEKKGEPVQGIEPTSSAYQPPNALPLGQTGSLPNSLVKYPCLSSTLLLGCQPFTTHLIIGPNTEMQA